jgi:hypothetical protein
MPVVMIGDFGKNAEGVMTYRINATSKDDLYMIIEKARDVGYKFWDTPNIEKAFNTWSVLLQIYIPKEMGYPEEEIS